MNPPEQQKIQFGCRRRGTLFSQEDFENASALADAIAINYLKRGASIRVLGNRILEPDMLAGMRAYLPGKPFLKSWKEWIGMKLPVEPSVMRTFSSRIFLSPFEPFEFSNRFWDLTGRFLPDVTSGSFPAFTGYARLGIIAVRVEKEVFIQIARYLEMPDQKAEDP